MTNFKSYPRGFIFGTLAFTSVPKEYNTFKILDKYYYSASNETPHLMHVDDDSFIVIHGQATFVHYSDRIIKNDKLAEHLLFLFNNDYSSFLDEIDFVAGRYAIIIGSKYKVNVYQDASGSRSVYYSTIFNVVSSHAHLINDNFTHAIDQTVSEIYKLGIQWTYSPFLQIKALIPNLSFELYTKAVKRFFPRSSNRYTSLTLEDKVNYVDTLWKKQQDHFFQNFSRLACSITGGLDSRTSMSLLDIYYKDVKFFTYHSDEINADKNKSKRILLIDKVRMDEILKDIDLNHDYIDLTRVEKKLSEEDLFILQKNTIGKHNYGLLRSYKNLFPEKNTLHIRSTIHEIGRSTYLEKDNGNNLRRIRAFFKRTFYQANKEKIDKLMLDLDDIVDEGIQNLRLEDNMYDYHIVDMFYWQNLMGRWYSEILNETDVCFETFSGYSLRAIIDISLSFNFDERKSGLLFKELINKNFPILNFYGINNETANLYEKYRELQKNYQTLQNKINVLEQQKKDNTI